jgi:hypothetical protein
MTRIESNKPSVGDSSNISKAFLNDLRRTGPVTNDSGLDVFVVLYNRQFTRTFTDWTSYLHDCYTSQIE